MPALPRLVVRKGGRKICTGSLRMDCQPIAAQAALYDGCAAPAVTPVLQEEMFGLASIVIRAKTPMRFSTG